MNKNDSTLSLENKFEIEALKLKLKNDPEKAQELAVEYFTNWLIMSECYYKLQEQCANLIFVNENLENLLKEIGEKNQVDLPPF